MNDSEYSCVRCGRERKEHDTNIVLAFDSVLIKIGALEIEPGYKMSLLDCCETKRPESYEKLVWKLSGTTPSEAIGWGAGYVSPDPEAEYKNKLSDSAMSIETAIYFPKGFGGPAVDISG